MKKIKFVLNIVMGSCVGVFIGCGIYTFVDFKTHPGLYAMQSAPWYTGIIVNGAFTLAVLVVGIVIKAIIKLKMNKKR